MCAQRLSNIIPSLVTHPHFGAQFRIYLESFHHLHLSQSVHHLTARPLVPAVASTSQNVIVPHEQQQCCNNWLLLYSKGLSLVSLRENVKQEHFALQLGECFVLITEEEALQADAIG